MLSDEKLRIPMETIREHPTHILSSFIKYDPFFPMLNNMIMQ